MDADAAPLIPLGEFDRVDTSRRPEEYARWMDHQRRRQPDRSIEALGVGADDRVLDIGCGTGVDLQTLSAAARLAVGVDLSATMLGATREWGAERPLTVARADGQRLPFSTAAFDVCSCRAVLVHTPDPATTVAEIARVLRPGGRALLAEPDQGSHIVATTEPDVFDRLCAHRRSTFRHPRIGRSLADLAVAAGLTIVDCKLRPILHRSLASARAAGGPFGVAVDAAVADGAITAAEADAYLRSLEALDERGAFVFAAMAFAVTATR